MNETLFRDTCETCSWWKQYHAEVLDRNVSARDFSVEELTRAQICTRAGQGCFFLSLKEHTCALHETKLERAFWWVKWVFPWRALKKSRRLGKKQLEIRFQEVDTRHALRCGVKCIYKALLRLFDFWKTNPPIDEALKDAPELYVIKPYQVVLQALDDVGSMADDPAFSGLIQNLGILRPEIASFRKEKKS